MTALSSVALIGSQFVVPYTFSRPADTTAYAALDVVSNSTSSPIILSWAAINRVSGASGYFVKARIVTDQVACVARFKLHLFSATLTPLNDNAPYTLLYANNAIKIGALTFPAMATEGSGSTGAAAQLSPGDYGGLPMAATPAAQTIYGMLETLDAFTPASGQGFFIELTMDSN